MYPGLSGAFIPERKMIDVDVRKEESILDIAPRFAACASNGNDAKVTIFPIEGRPKFGLFQPRIKSSGGSVTAVAFSPFEPKFIYVGTSGGDITSWEIPENGLACDLLKPLNKYDSGSEVKSMAIHPTAKTLLAAGLRSGHVVILDGNLNVVADLEHTRPINAVSWSYDGKYVYALHVDMLLRIWDVRAKSIVVEKKIINSRAVGYLEPLPGDRIAVSYNEKKQEVRILNHQLEEVAARTFETAPVPLRLRYHFTGLLVAQTCKATKINFLNAKDLSDVYEFNCPDMIFAAAPEIIQPDPDGDRLMDLTVIMAGNVAQHLRLTVDKSHLPIKFPPMPVLETELTAEKYMAGENFELKTLALNPTVKEEEVVDEGPQEEVVQIVTRYRYLNAESDPPRNYFTYLPVGIVPNMEFNEICTNGKQFAFIGQGNPSQICFMNLDKPTRYPINGAPCIKDPHKSTVSYITYSPHNPNLLMSAGDDGKIRLWDVPDVLKQDITEPRISLQMPKRVGLAKFSDAVRNLVLATCLTPEIAIWDLNKEKQIRSFQKQCPSIVQDSTFNSLSNAVYSVFKDGTVSVFDPRSEDPVVATGQCHPGPRHRRILDLPDYNRFATFGVSKKGWREISIWDPANLSAPLKTVELDTQSSPLLPMYEEGSGVIYCGGKGDGNVPFVELCRDDRIIACQGSYDSAEPERGLCLIPRKYLDVKSVEISRMLKLSTESLRALHWRTPRNRQEYFQDDIYQPSRDTSNALMEVLDWEDGQTESFPELNIQPEGMKKLSEAQPIVKPKARKYLPGGQDEQEDLANKKLTIDEIVAMAPKISTESDDEKEEESDSW